MVKLQGCEKALPTGSPIVIQEENAVTQKCKAALSWTCGEGHTWAQIFCPECAIRLGVLW